MNSTMKFVAAWLFAIGAVPTHMDPPDLTPAFHIVEGDTAAHPDTDTGAGGFGGPGSDITGPDPAG